MPVRISNTGSAGGRRRQVTPPLPMPSRLPSTAPKLAKPSDGEPAIPSLTVAVVDPNTLPRTALPIVLPEFTFTDSFRTADDLLTTAPAADVVLLEIARGAGDHAPLLVWTRAVRSMADAGYRVCIHTTERRQAVLLGCLSAGATSIAHKTDSVDDLRLAVRAAAAGQLVVTPFLAGLAELAEREQALPSLTERQRMVLSARARGEKFESIARRLFISRKVAEEHWATVAGKFAGFLRDHSPADLERLLGLDPGDLVDRSPAEPLAWGRRTG